MLIEATTEIASRITGAIRDAAQATGASFDYLLKTALRESSLNPTAQAATSSAKGLFQFIDQTWLATLKKAGPSLGYGDAAQSIVQTSSGKFVVPDATRRKEIMNLRNDPQASAAMAGAFTKSNAAVLKKKIGRDATDGELYIAHFMGASGAAKLINSAAARPGTSAAALFPHAAKVNRSIFYTKQGAARSTAQVYAQLISKHEKTQTPDAIAAIAAAMPQQAVSPVALSAAVPMPASRPQSVTAVQVASVAQGMDAVPVSRAAYASEDRPVFYGLFRTDSRAPVSETVNRFWGAQASGGQATPSPTAASAPVVAAAVQPASARPAPAVGKPLNLFQFLHRDIQAKASDPA
ncbi:MAG: lytic transglycosylase domain-containing protein [Variibacter sp.]